MQDPGTRRQWVLAALDRYEASLVRYAVGLLGDGDSAREAVQHAFLQLCEQAPEKLRRREAPWLFRVCRNKAMDMIRLRRRTTGCSEADRAFTMCGWKHTASQSPINSSFFRTTYAANEPC
jgi:DNA-directed RNA polymerase specialized sigma24 family protein